MYVLLEGVASAKDIDTAMKLGYNLNIGPLEMADAIDHCFVLGRSRNQMVALLAVHLSRTLDRKVIGLGRTAGPDDFLGMGADEFGDLAPGLIDRSLTGPTKGMTATG